MKKECVYYIYLITNNILNKQYIGSRVCYKNDILSDEYWGSSKYLNEDYKIYGKENFKKEIIFQNNYVNKIDILNTETKYILEYNTLSPIGYNKYLPNKRMGFYMLGSKASKETKEKMSNAHKGKKFTNEHRKNLSNVQTGKLHPHIGGTFGQKPMLGKHHSEETKQKIRMNLDVKGEKNPMYNHFYTIETLEKISVSQKNRKKYTCVYCEKEMNELNFKRWHGEKCKYKIKIKEYASA